VIKILLASVILFSAIGVRAQSLTYCSEATPATFSPQLAFDTATFSALQGVYSRLVEFEPGTTKVSPSIARSYKISNDGRELLFSLRKDVQFHSTSEFTPTRPLNADDVIYTFARMRSPSHPYHYRGGGVYQYFDSLELPKIIKDIQRVDDYTVKFILTRPEAPLLSDLAMDFASIVSKEYAEKLLAIKKPELFDTHPVGTGPFQFKAYEKNKKIIYTAFDKYFLGAPKIKELTFAITVDPKERVRKLQTGECDVIAEPPYDAIATLKQDKKLKVVSQPGLNVFYLSINVAHKPFDNLKVRQALNYALNRQKYIDDVFHGFAQLAKNPIPPNMWGFNKTVQDYDYNPDRARKLLAEAGLPNGFEFNLHYMSESRPYNPNGKAVADLMVADLAKVGVKAKLVTQPWAQYLITAKDRTYDVMQMGWTSDNGDPDNFLNVLLSCAALEAQTNYANWCDKRFSFLTGRARVTTNIVQRTRFYEEAQDIFKKEAPWVTISHSTVFRAMRADVSGYRMSPFGVENFFAVEVKR
jgi:dipeptide transport system substrate-binding protein